tara:strand:- start:7103 stop:9199 length:2097 start_codon:yes stop_codon:yes gene_type:complete
MQAQGIYALLFAVYFANLGLVSKRVSEHMADSSKKSKTTKSKTVAKSAAKKKPVKTKAKANTKTKANKQTPSKTKDKKHTASKATQAQKREHIDAAASQDMLSHYPDPLALSNALMSAYQESQPLFIKMVERFSKDIGDRELTPPSEIPPPPDSSEAAIDLLKNMAIDPMRYWSMQMDYTQKQIDLMNSSFKRLSGEPAESVIEPERGDKRFKAEEWRSNPLFSFIKQYYLLASDHVQRTIDNAQDLPPEQKEQLSFAAGLMMDAMAPSNFLMTNPEALNETIRTGGKNLVKGLQQFSEDLERGRGELKISMTDKSAFKVGENIATTEGSVVYQNDLMQLIQYKPSTEKVFKTPLLIVPPWINKYYILDLRADNSLIKWAVDQGHSVFCISWVNPDKSHANKSFDAYMLEGILDSLNVIEKITGEKETNAIGYCLGGTLLTATMAYLEKKKQSSRIRSATLLTTLIDFQDAGQLKMFMGDKQIEAIERMMLNKGIFEGRAMQQTFNMLRANDLIWSFVVNNYLMGREPFPFDLLYWNDDATNLPAAMHSFYLRNMYKDNKLCVSDGINLDGIDIDISKVKTPCYFLSTKEDHIAPWQATYKTTQIVSGKKTFTLAASGHIAGIVNPPIKDKYCYWTNDQTPESTIDWFNKAKEQKGSWWPHWQSWISDYTGTKIKARSIKKSDIIEAAPGSYVLKQVD